MRLHPTVSVEIVRNVHFQYLQLADSHYLVVQLVEMLHVLAEHLLVRLAQRTLVVHRALLQIVQRERPAVVQEERPALAIDLLQFVEYHEAEHPVQSVQSGRPEGLLSISEVCN